MAQCTGFKCEAGKMDCCCCHLLFCQPDFVAQKSQLKEQIESHGHNCNFYPKFHCELNFIEQYWGAVKFHYQSTAKMEVMETMERNVIDCLNDVPLLQIRRSVIIICLICEFKLRSCIDMPIVQHGSSLHTLKDSLVHKQPGPTRDIMAIVLYLPP